MPTRTCVASPEPRYGPILSVYPIVPRQPKNPSHAPSTAADPAPRAAAARVATIAVAAASGGDESGSDGVNPVIFQAIRVILHVDWWVRCRKLGCIRLEVCCKPSATPAAGRYRAEPGCRRQPAKLQAYGSDRVGVHRVVFQVGMVVLWRVAVALGAERIWSTSTLCRRWRPPAVCGACPAGFDCPVTLLVMLGACR